MSIDIKDLKKRFFQDYTKHLEGHGVKMPGPRQIGPMLCLYHNLGSPVSQDEITAWCREHNFPDYNKQIRHLAAAGWYLSTGNRRTHNMLYDEKMSNNQICLVSIKLPNPIQTAVRTAVMPNGEFSDLIVYFETHRGGCAVCGKMSRHKDGTPNYDKGHLSRNKSAVAGNVAPICPSCNNKMQRDNLEWYLDENLVCSPAAFRGKTPEEHITAAMAIWKKQGVDLDEVLASVTQMIASMRAAEVSGLVVPEASLHALSSASSKGD